MQLAIRNWQRSHQADLPLLRRITKSLLLEHLKVADADLGIFLVAAPEMTRLNENFLHHAGSTDVITFDYSEPENPSRRAAKRAAPLHGEIFVCMDESVIQARKFRTTWPSEIVRYIIHGVLHLLGHDDVSVTGRKKMKVAENQLLAQLGKEFDFRRLDKGRGTPKLRP